MLALEDKWCRLVPFPYSHCILNTNFNVLFSAISLRCPTLSSCLSLSLLFVVYLLPQSVGQLNMVSLVGFLFTDKNRLHSISSGQMCTPLREYYTQYNAYQ